MALNLVYSETDIETMDMIEHIADLNDWSFERSSQEEVTIIHQGKWALYQVSFSWHPTHEALQVAASFDMRVPDLRLNEFHTLITHINAQLWMGHFDIWQRDGVMIFRQALLLAGGANITTEQIEKLMQSAVETTENYYPAFQYVAWAGQNSIDALNAVLYETVGEA